MLAPTDSTADTMTRALATTIGSLTAACTLDVDRTDADRKLGEDSAHGRRPRPVTDRTGSLAEKNALTARRIRREMANMTDEGRRNRRVLHVTSSLARAGMEHMVVRLAGHQRSAGRDASILSIWGGPLLEEARAQGTPVYVVDLPGRLGRLARIGAFVARAAPELVHAHNPTSLHLATVARLVAEAMGRLRGDLTRCPMLMTDHQSEGLRAPSSFEWSRTDAVVSVSQRTAETSPAWHKARMIRVIPNGVDVASSRRSREEVRAELNLDGELMGIAVGNIRPEKDYDNLVRACGLLRDRGTRLPVMIVGAPVDTKAAEATKALAQSVGLGPSELRFLGARADVPDLLRAADVFVLSSMREGLPLALLEAMSVGLPVVATSVGGVPEVMHDGVHGLVVPAQSPAALAEALGRLAGDAALRREAGERAAARARDHFSLARMAGDYDALYDELWSRAR